MNSNLMFLHLNQTQAQSLSEPISYAKQCEWLIDSYAFDLLTISTANFFFSVIHKFSSMSFDWLEVKLCKTIFRLSKV